MNRASSASRTASIQKATNTVDEIYHTRWDAGKSLILKRTETQKGMTGENESLAAVKNHSETSIPDLTLSPVCHRGQWFLNFDCVRVTSKVCEHRVLCPELVIQ